MDHVINVDKLLVWGGSIAVDTEKLRISLLIKYNTFSVPFMESN